MQTSRIVHAVTLKAPGRTNVPHALIVHVIVVGVAAINVPKEPRFVILVQMPVAFVGNVPGMNARVRIQAIILVM